MLPQEGLVARHYAGSARPPQGEAETAVRAEDTMTELSYSESGGGSSDPGFDDDDLVSVTPSHTPEGSQVTTPRTGPLGSLRRTSVQTVTTPRTSASLAAPGVPGAPSAEDHPAPPSTATRENWSPAAEVQHRGLDTQPSGSFAQAQPAVDVERLGGSQSGRLPGNSSGSGRQLRPENLLSEVSRPSLSSRQQTRSRSQWEVEAVDTGAEKPQTKELLTEDLQKPKKRSICSRVNPLMVVVRCPCLFSFVVAAAAGVTVGLGLVAYPVKPDTDFEAFMKADVNSSLLQDGFAAAVQALPFTNGRRLAGFPMYRIFDISVAYELKDGISPKGVFQVRVLRAIGSFESHLRSLPKFKELCDMAEPKNRLLCNPGISFANYALSTPNVSEGSVVPSSITTDGSARDMLPLEVVDYIIRQRGLEELLLPKDYTRFDAFLGPQCMRSTWRFKIYCCTSEDPLSMRHSRLTELKEKWDTFASDVLLPTLQKAFQDKEDPVKISWEGSDLTSLEVMQTLWQDIYLAAGCVIFVLMYLAIHTKSALLTCTGFLVIPLSLPISYLIFVMLSGSTSIGIASFISVFVILGLGADVVFVYTDMWNDSGLHEESDAGRLAWTYIQAGKATIATTSTTALSFLANLASVLRPLREFGLFMGLCVTIAWILVSLIFVPLCLADERMGLCRVSRNTHRRSERRSARVCGCWVKKLSTCRFCCVMPLMLTVLFLVLAVLNAKPDEGVLSLFPEDHNQNHGKEVLAQFVQISDVMPLQFDAPPEQEDICWDSDENECVFNWCEVNPSIAVVGSYNSTCQCYRKHSHCGGSAAVFRRIRLVGLDTLTEDDLKGSISQFVGAGNLVAKTLPKLLLQDWEAGRFVFAPVMEASTLAPEPARCGWEDRCFCGTPVCRDISDTWTPRPALELRGADARRLASAMTNSLLTGSEWQVPSALHTHVEVAWGLKVKTEVSLIRERELANSWEFLPAVDFRQPWAQRDIYRMCTEFPKDLRVVYVDCWIVDFREFLQKLNPAERFPVTANKFDRLLDVFMDTGMTGTGLSKRYLWIRNNTLKACFVKFQVDFNKQSGPQAALAYKDKWDEYLRQVNLMASDHTKGAFHVCSLWTTAEAQQALLESTVTTLGIVLILAFFTMLVSTRDIALSLHVVFATVSVISGLAFFMVVVARWTVGPIEVLALIVFVGYALDYSLHVAHKYGCNEALRVPLPPKALDERRPRDRRYEVRFKRVMYALKSMGGATMGSAITTSGCSLFLIFCQLTIFRKLGIVLVVVTALSIITALSSLPATLLVIGPQYPGQRCPRNLKDLRALKQRAVYYAKNPAVGLKAFVGWMIGKNSQVEDDSDECDSAKPPQKFLATPAKWRRRKMGLEVVFEEQNLRELSLGIQAAHASADPILEVGPPLKEGFGGQAFVLKDLRPAPVSLPALSNRAAVEPASL